MKFNLQSEFDDALKYITGYTTAENSDKRESLLLRLMCEDILNFYQADSSFSTVDIQFEKLKSLILVSVTIPGKRLDPLMSEYQLESAAIINFYKNAYRSAGTNIQSGPPFTGRKAILGGFLSLFLFAAVQRNG